IFCLVFIIVFGTMVPYMMFLNGVKYIGPTKSSLYASVEPLSSTIVSVLWLKVQLEFIDYIGFLFIVITVLMLSLAKPKPQKA
ncbi:MAG: EamA family transporter, partial [Anaerotignum sp.]